MALKEGHGEFESVEVVFESREWERCMRDLKSTVMAAERKDWGSENSDGADRDEKGRRMDAIESGSKSWDQETRELTTNGRFQRMGLTVNFPRNPLRDESVRARPVVPLGEDPSLPVAEKQGERYHHKTRILGEASAAENFVRPRDVPHDDQRAQRFTHVKNVRADPVKDIEGVEGQVGEVCKASQGIPFRGIVEDVASIPEVPEQFQTSQRHRLDCDATEEAEGGGEKPEVLDTGASQEYHVEPFVWDSVEDYFFYRVAREGRRRGLHEAPECLQKAPGNRINYIRRAEDYCPTEKRLGPRCAYETRSRIEAAFSPVPHAPGHAHELRYGDRAGQSC
ncbi:hypothetical protein DFH09DRAFT_1424049 [Mycena vulgaris]|nr:hypothetical protein DFH09DRAFT_1424049 [Mycena vulgaris]